MPPSSPDHAGFRQTAHNGSACVQTYARCPRRRDVSSAKFRPHRDGHRSERSAQRCQYRTYLDIQWQPRPYRESAYSWHVTPIEFLFFVEPLKVVGIDLSQTTTHTSFRTERKYVVRTRASSRLKRNIGRDGRRPKLHAILVSSGCSGGLSRRARRGRSTESSLAKFAGEPEWVCCRGRGLTPTAA